MILSWARRITELAGWQRFVAAYGLGLLAALAFPPFNLIPILWLSFPAFYFLVQGAQGARSAFATGWSFAFGLLTISLYWIAGALFVDIKSFWWALPFAVFGLPGAFAIYYGIAAVIAWKWDLSRRDGPLFMALCWFGAEIARAHLFTGFPWDILGYVWADCLPVLQSASIIGIEGLTLLTAILALLPALLVERERRRIGIFVLVVGLIVFGAGALWGSFRLAQASSQTVPNVKLRLVQPSIEQAMKWKAEKRFENFEQLMRTTFSEPGNKPITHFIWPETATAYYLTEEPEIRAHIAKAMPPKSILISGTVRREAMGDRPWRYYNSLIAMDANGTVLAGYDKYHLVPFGEYMPFRSVVPFRVISTMGADFTAGEAIRTVRAPSLPPFSALVCYEAIFSGEVVEKNDPPQFLLNITNDGWYKGTIGPDQHFAISRVRAVEEGIPLVRVANMGTTAVVDPYGRIVVSIGRHHPGFVDSDLPQPIPARTAMAVLGLKAAYLMAGALMCLLLCFRSIIRTRKV